MIDIEQKREFKRKGFLVLDDVIDQSVVEEARSEVWNALPCSPSEAPEELEGEGYSFINDIDNVTPFAEIRKSVFEVAEELVGEDVLTPPEEPFEIPADLQIPVNNPSSLPYKNAVARRITSSHLDGYGMAFRDPSHEAQGTYRYYTLGAGIYIDDVKTGGGGFTVFPGSHWVVSEYFKTHSLESPGWKGIPPAIDDSGSVGQSKDNLLKTGGWDYRRRLDEQLIPHEITGPAGTVTLWHMKILHGNGVNHRPMPRIAAFTRYTHEEGDSIKRDVAGKPWADMGELADIEAKLEENPVYQESGFQTGT